MAVFTLKKPLKNCARKRESSGLKGVNLPFGNPFIRGFQQELPYVSRYKNCILGGLVDFEDFAQPTFPLSDIFLDYKSCFFYPPYGRGNDL